MARLYNLARVTTSTTGTGTITLGAAVSGYLTFALAGASDGDIVAYGIKDGANSEVGTGTYTSAGTTLTRTVTKSTNSNTAISLSGSAEVFITARAEDIATIPQCGRLTYVSATAVKFAPFNGDQIKISGSIYVIPSAGIAGVANTSVFVGGVAAQNLAASTLYYVYAFINSGTVTADFRTGGHATSSTAGNVGVEILSGDDTRTYLGMVFTNGSSQFDDSSAKRNVISWFNKRNIGGLAFFTATRTTTSASYVELNSEIRVEFCTEADEAVFAGQSGSIFNSTSGQNLFCALAFDGATAEDAASGISPPANVQYPFSSSIVKNGLTVGHHYATVVALTSGGTLSAYVQSNSAGLRYSLSVGIRG